MELKETGWEDVDWLHLAQDGDQWRELCEHGDERYVSMGGGGISLLHE
jgi:hypothetical protein